MFDTTEKPGIIERYETAGNTSDLTVEADQGGAGDLLIAAGWSQSRIGMALLRLHSEWSGMAKPKRADRNLIESMAATMPDAKGKPDMHAARRAANDWYVNELRILANGLKSRSTVWRELAPYIARKQIAPETAAAALLHWLDQTCRACDGLKQRKIAGTPALSAKVCPSCQGTGLAHQPRGTARLITYMDDCVSRARQSLKRRLRPA